METTRPVRRSALHHRLASAGARMRIERGWEIAETVGDPAAGIREMEAAVVMADVSDRFLRLISGADLADWFPRLPSVGELAPFADDGLCCRLTSDSALLVTPHPPALSIASDRSLCSVDLTGGRTGIRLAGKHAASVLMGATQLDMRDRSFPTGRCAQTSLARVPALIMRFDRAGIPTYEILVARDFGEYLWETLLDAGLAWSLQVVGRSAFPGGS